VVSEVSFSNHVDYVTCFVMLVCGYVDMTLGIACVSQQ